MQPRSDVPAPWVVDAASLREVLDAVHALLPRTVPRTGAVIQSIEAARLCEAVRSVLQCTDGSDLEARRALPSGSSPAYWAGSSDLREILDDVHRKIRARFRDRLSATAAALARRLLAKNAPDLLAVFGKQNDENAHSDVIAWFLTPRCARTVAPALLASLMAHLDARTCWQELIKSAIASDTLSVRREFVIGREWGGVDSLDRVDIVISGPGFVLAIENKLWSAEHEGQTVSYWRWLAAQPGLRAGILLSPVGVPAQSNGFKPLSYLDLICCLLDALARAEVSEHERHLLAAYMTTLARHVLRVELSAISEGETG